MIKWDNADGDAAGKEKKAAEMARKEAEQKAACKKKRAEALTGAVSSRVKEDILKKALKLAGTLETDEEAALLTEIITGLTEKTGEGK